MYHIPLHGLRDIRNVLSIGRLRWLLSGIRPDVIHSHDAYSNMVVLAALWPRFAIPWVSSRRWLDQIVRPAHARLNHLAFMRSSMVTVNATSVSEYMQQTEGVPERQLTVVPNFVQVPELAPVWPRESSQHTVIGMVSRLTPIKRHDIAIHAVRKLVDEGFDVHLVIVGEGESRPSIERLVDEVGLRDRVTLKGEKRGGAALHAEFDISLATSDSEGSPNSVLEGMAAGRPVVATDVGGTRDVLRPGVDGILVPPGDSGAIACAIRTILEKPELFRIYGDAGRARAQASFSAEAISGKLFSLYKQVAGFR